MPRTCAPICDISRQCFASWLSQETTARGEYTPRELLARPCCTSHRPKVGDDLRKEAIYEDGEQAEGSPSAEGSEATRGMLVSALSERVVFVEQAAGAAPSRHR